MRSRFKRYSIVSYMTAVRSMQRRSIHHHCARRSYSIRCRTMTMRPVNLIDDQKKSPFDLSASDCCEFQFENNDCQWEKQIIEDRTTLNECGEWKASRDLYFCEKKGRNAIFIAVRSASVRLMISSVETFGCDDWPCQPRTDSSGYRMRWRMECTASSAWYRKYLPHRQSWFH
jgi:hypothetical protein